MAKRNPRSEADDTTTATPASREPRGSDASRSPEGRQPAGGGRGRDTAENARNATAVEEVAPQSADTFAARPTGTAANDADDMASARETSSAAIGDEAGPSEEEIRFRAYEIYVERGGEHGMDFEDWLRAERELRQNRNR